MVINIKGTNFDLSDKAKSYIENRIQRLMKQIVFGGEAVKIWVELERDKKHRKGEIFRAEIQIYIPKASVHSEARGESWRTAFDRAKNKIDDDLRKYKIRGKF